MKKTNKNISTAATNSHGSDGLCFCVQCKKKRRVWRRINDDYTRHHFIHANRYGARSRVECSFNMSHHSNWCNNQRGVNYG